MVRPAWDNWWILAAIDEEKKAVQNGPFLGNDERLFWQRAEDRNRATASLYDQLGKSGRAGNFFGRS